MASTRIGVLAITAALLLPLASGVPGNGAEPGLGTACKASDNDNPCRGLIPDTNVGPGQKKKYTGNYIAVGTVTVQAGGTVEVIDANISFRNTSDGFVAEPGSTLLFVRSKLVESTADAAYGIDARVATNFTLNDTVVDGGDGVKVATQNASISGSTLRNIPVALALTDVTVTIHHNAFAGNVVSVNQTGGSPTLAFNSFQGGQFCVRDWRTNPTIVNNVFRGCHIGILHEESESRIEDNDMADDALPPGVGLWILNTQSPIIENNTIREYGTGIRIENARGFVRNNTIEDNVGNGVHILSNSLPMDIQGNAIRRNGGAGVRLVGAVDVPVFNNLIEDNGAGGIVLDASPNAALTGNVLRNNAGPGIHVLANSPGATLDGNTVEAAGGEGIAVFASSTLTANAVEGSATNGIVILATSTLTNNVVSGSGASGILVRADDTVIAGGSASGNGAHGIELDEALDVQIDGVEALQNGEDGVFIGASRAEVTGVNASENGRNGFTFNPMGPLELLGDTPFHHVRAMHNAGAGLHNVEGNATTATQSWWEGNGVGVKNDDLTSLIDARDCYWGDPSGPTHPLNPLGTGDSIEGGVLYHPVLTTPPGDGPADVVARAPRL